MAGDVTGADKIARNLAAVGRNLPREAGRAVLAEGAVDLEQMRIETPLADEGARAGALRASLRLKKVDDLTVQLIAGGGTVDYAVKVHEDLQAKHEVGRAKYMEIVVLQSKGTMGDRLASRVDLKRTF